MEAEKLRDAFYASVQGCQKLVGSESFPNQRVESAAIEVTRALGPNSDRRPTFTMLVEALRCGNPQPVLDCIGALCGVRWERVANRPAEELARVREQLAQMQLALNATRETVEAVGEKMEQRGAA